MVGSDYMSKFDLFPQSSGYSRSYNEDLDPRINNEFATAAFRCEIYIATVRLSGLVISGLVTV